MLYGDQVIRLRMLQTRDLRKQIARLESIVDQNPLLRLSGDVADVADVMKYLLDSLDRCLLAPIPRFDAECDPSFHPAGFSYDGRDLIKEQEADPSLFDRVRAFHVDRVDSRFP